MLNETFSVIFKYRDQCIPLHLKNTFLTGSVNVQCHQYWPTKVGTSQTFDYIEVHNVDEEDFVAGQVVLRYLNLKSKFILQIEEKRAL